MKKFNKLIILTFILFLTLGLAACGDKQFKVKFNLNGGISTYHKEVLVSSKRKLVEPPEPTYDGFTFEGWFLNGEIFDFETKIQEDIILVAQWKPIDNLDQYTAILLNSNNRPELNEDVITNEIHEISFQYAKVFDAEKGFVTLTHTGLLTNTTPIAGLSGVAIKFKKLTDDAKLNVYYGTHALPISNEITAVDELFITFDKPANFFVIEALDKRFVPKDFDEITHGRQPILKEPAKAVVEITHITLYLNEEETEIYTQKAVPKMYVDVALDDNGKPLPIKNKEDYVDSMIRIVDSENEENSLGGEEGLVAGIRLRGNSTRTLPKRPYKIKFDKKQTIFGLPSAKDWALLADYLDGSALHNYSALKMGYNLGTFDFIAHPNFVELYLNDVYQGLYLFVEHQEVKEGRVEIEQNLKDDIPLEEMNFMFELDRSAIHYPDAEIEGIDYFRLENKDTGKYKDHFYSIKYPKKKDFEKAFGVSEETDARYDEFFNYVKQYVDGLYDVFKTKDKEAFKNQVDVETLLDFMMIDFIMLETDHKFQSVKMHYIAEEGKLYFGPIWDYDSMVMGLPYEKTIVEYPFDKAYDPAYVIPYKRTSIYNHFFKAFFDYQDGDQLLKERYNEKGSELIANMIYHLENEVIGYIALNLINDANIWYKGDISDIFENVKYMVTYLELRKEFLDNRFK